MENLEGYVARGIASRVAEVLREFTGGFYLYSLKKIDARQVLYREIMMNVI